MAKVLPAVDLWTVKEAATYLRISVKWMYEVARIPEKDGGPPIKRPLNFAIRKGRKMRDQKRTALRFPREQFIAWANREDRACSA